MMMPPVPPVALSAAAAALGRTPGVYLGRELNPEGRGQVGGARCSYNPNIDQVARRVSDRMRRVAARRTAGGDCACNGGVPQVLPQGIRERIPGGTARALRNRHGRVSTRLGRNHHRVDIHLSSVQQGSRGDVDVPGGRSSDRRRQARCIEYRADGGREVVRVDAAVRGRGTAATTGRRTVRAHADKQILCGAVLEYRYGRASIGCAVSAHEERSCNTRGKDAVRYGDLPQRRPARKSRRTSAHIQAPSVPPDA